MRLVYVVLAGCVKQNGVVMSVRYSVGMRLPDVAVALTDRVNSGRPVSGRVRLPGGMEMGKTIRVCAHNEFTRSIREKFLK